MRATYKLGRDVITEFEAQNAGNSISGVQISKHFPGGGGNARYWNEPRSRYEAGSAPDFFARTYIIEHSLNFQILFGETGNCFLYFFVYFLRILYTCRIRVLSPYPRFIPISTFYPQIRVLSPNPRFIPISVFYPHIRVLSPYPLRLSAPLRVSARPLRVLS